MITYNQMVRKLAKDGTNIHNWLTPAMCDMWHMSSCLMGEAGELLEGLGDHENIVEELGDLEWFMEGLRDGTRISYEEVCDVIPTVASDLKLDYVNGIVVESCNIFNVVKKTIIYEQELNRANLVRAMACFEYYMACFRGSLDIKRDECLKANMAKLAKRYGPDYEYTNQKAKERADKQS
jgi:hypothetical protein